MKTLLNKIPTSSLIIFAILLGLAPFVPEPHLWQKLGLLFSGNLVKAIDIFDLFMHGTPLILLLLKLFFTYSDNTADNTEK